MFAMNALLAVVQSSSDSDGLSFAEILSNLPRDPASIFALLLLAGAVGAILWVGRPRRPRTPGAVP